MFRLRALFPLLDWLQDYRRETLLSDLVAGIIVAVMLVPQGMAYAFLAGLPPQYGLYAGILPLMVYALLGSSRTLAVGPVAIASLMVGSTVSTYTPQGEQMVLNAAIHLSLLVGLCLLLLRLLRLGSIVNFMSHSVISGFTSAAALVIAISQLKYLLALDIPRDYRVDQQLGYILQHLSNINLPTLSLGLAALVILWFSKNRLHSVLQRTVLPCWLTAPIAKAGPMFAILISVILVWMLELDAQMGVATVGVIPQGLPELGTLSLDLSLAKELIVPASLIALIGFLESVSVGTALASKRRERIDPNKELVALGSANLAAAFSGTYPVAGGFGRSMVNFSAGAQTTIASLISALVLALVVSFLTPLFYYLPHAALGAIIIMAVLPLIDIDSLRNCWRFNRADAMTLLTTVFAVLALGVELGIISGIAISIALLLYRASQPHIAIVGRVGDSEHFRNEKRHEVTTAENTLALRIDESLYFANTRYVESYVLAQSANRPELRHIVLICTAVNFIDASAVETLESLVVHLRNAGVTLHLAEVKGPVQDQLSQTHFFEQLGEGRVFFTTDEAMKTLAGV